MSAIYNKKEKNMRHKIRKKYVRKLTAIVLILGMATTGIFQGDLKVFAKNSKSDPALNITSKRIQEGKTFTLKVKKLPKNIKARSIKFTSTNKSIASVSTKGRVKGNKSGKVIIKCEVSYKEKLNIKGKTKWKKCSKILKCSVSVYTKIPQSVKISQAPTESPTEDNEPTKAPTLEPVETASPVPTPGENKPAESDKPSEDKPTKTAMPTERPATDMTSDAYQMVHDLGLGINLGNTMESVSNTKLSSVNAYETYWGAPITTKAMVDGMKNAGFKTVRIPVAWSNMVSDDGNYTISDAYFKRVEEIIGYALDNNMYVIVNIHYDGGWWGQFGACKKDSAGNIIADDTRRAAAWKRYKSYWKQISERFKDYSDHVIFESANEELGTRLNDALDPSGYQFTDGMKEEDLIKGNLTDDEKYALVNEINQTFVDIVRASGGNNADRFLLIAGYDTDITKTCDARYKMPTDTIKSHLMVSVHYYSPYGYCDVSDPSHEWYIASWGSEDEISTLKSDFKKMKLKFVDKGYPVIIGEYNVCDTKNADGSYTRKKGREVFIKNVCEYALANGMCPVLWDTGMGYSRSQYRISNDVDKNLFEELAVKAENSIVYVPDEEKNEYVWTGNIGASSWNSITTVASDDNWNLSVTAVGAAYKLADIDWAKFSKPYLEIKINSLTGGKSVGYKVSNEVNKDNEYYNYIEDSKAKETGTFNLDNGNSLKIDLSQNGLSSYDNIYIGMVDSDFSANVTITIKDSSK